MHEEIINKRNGQQYYYKQNGGFIDNTQKYTQPTMWYQNKTKSGMYTQIYRDF